MQFKEDQKAALSANWGEGSWFYQNLGLPAREIVERAYGLRDCTEHQRAASQEALNLILSVFARRIGASKSQVVHAVLTGSVESLMEALGRKAHVRHVNSIVLKEDWEASFRDAVSGTL